MNTWLLLSESRGRILRFWNICTGIVLLFVLIQTVTGKLAGIEGTAWAWAIGTLIPGLLMLNVGAWTNKSPSKIIHPAAHRAMLAAAMGYLLLVFCTLLFSQAAIEQNDYGLDTWLTRSLTLLLPFQVLILIGFWLIFFKKDSIFRPNPQIILDVANKKAQQARSQGKTLRLQCLDLVAANNLPEAFDHLKAYFEKNNTENFRASVVLSGEYNSLLREAQLNTIDPAQVQRNINRVTIAVLELAEDVAA